MNQLLTTSMAFKEGMAQIEGKMFQLFLILNILNLLYGMHVLNTNQYI